MFMDETEEITYSFDELDKITHAYAVTVHRSQGSEYPCVILPLSTSAWLMLRRTLLYTAVTRAKRLVALVGSKRAIRRAVRMEGAGRRYAMQMVNLRRQDTNDAARSIVLSTAGGHATISLLAITSVLVGTMCRYLEWAAQKRRASVVENMP